MPGPEDDQLADGPAWQRLTHRFLLQQSLSFFLLGAILSPAGRIAPHLPRSPRLPLRGGIIPQPRRSVRVRAASPDAGIVPMRGRVARQGDRVFVDDDGEERWGGYAVVFDDGLTRWDGCDGMVAAPRYLALGIGWAGIYPPGSLGASSRRVGAYRDLFWEGRWCGVLSRWDKKVYCGGLFVGGPTYRAMIL